MPTIKKPVKKLAAKTATGFIPKKRVIKKPERKQFQEIHIIFDNQLQVDLNDNTKVNEIERQLGLVVTKLNGMIKDITSTPTK